METNNIDNILHSFGFSSASSSPSPQESSAQSSHFTEDDVSDILEQNGFSEQTLEESDEGNEEEDNSDEASALGQEQPSSHSDGPLGTSAASDDSQQAASDNSQVPDNAMISLNSPTLLVDESTTRFSGTEWFDEIQKARVIIAGVGGIGSNVAFQLARMVPDNITLYDDDVVEIVNMAGQLFSRGDVGKTKVNAIVNMISSYTSMGQINAVPDKFTDNTEPGDIMICGFDNMRARRTFFLSWLRHVASKDEAERSKCLFLDGRLSIDTLQILCIRGNDNYNIERYQREFLFHDFEADATVCSMKQTTYMACMIGSLMVNLFTNFIADSLNPIIPYDLPFFTEYNAQHMLFKTEH